MEQKQSGMVCLVAGILCLIARDLKISCIILACGMLLQFFMISLQRKKREKNIEELISYLSRVQDGLGLPSLSTMQEGQLGILQSEIYKLVAILQEQYSKEQQEKTYLADMLSNISHQVKTPIAAITILLDLLQEPDLDQQKRMEYTNKIDKQINRITWLVKNLLALSQLEAGMLTLKKEQITMEQLLKKSSEPFEIMAELKGVELEVSIPEKVEILCDFHWTREAVSNIIKNCIEHTKEGGAVSVWVEQNNIVTHIYVKDTGEGISKKDMAHIFERFYKGEHASNNSVGIGLAMAKEIFLKQNGTIEVESEPGKGSCFHLKMYRVGTV